MEKRMLCRCHSQRHNAFSRRDFPNHIAGRNVYVRQGDKMRPRLTITGKS